MGFANDVTCSGIRNTDDIVSILVATDNHLGYLERDPIRGNDSFVAFEEILLHARKQNVRHHFSLLGFHSYSLDYRGFSDMTCSFQRLKIHEAIFNAKLFFRSTFSCWAVIYSMKTSHQETHYTKLWL
jgi:hypothetical protein